MKMIYISHPYTGDEKNNMQDARQIARQLAKATNGQVLFINPLDTFSHCTGVLDYMPILEQCIELLERCDGVIFCNGWTRSRGCQAEMEKALQAKKAIWFGAEHFLETYAAKKGWTYDEQ